MRSLIIYLFNTCLSIIVSCLLLLSSSEAASTAKWNITRLLKTKDGYGSFNSLLSQTHLASEINSRNTITVLAIHDSSISGLSSKPTPMIKRILMNHILLDYYTIYRLKHMKKGSELLTTLYQTTGDARNGNGHINVTDMGNGEVRIGSGVRGSQLDVSLNKLISARPYNITAHEVSGPIIAPGVEDMDIPPGASPRKMGPTPAAAPAPHTKKHHKHSPPAYSPDMEDTDEDTSDDPTADGPAADGDSAPAPSKSGASFAHKRTTFCLVVAAMITTFLLAQ